MSKKTTSESYSYDESSFRTGTGIDYQALRDRLIEQQNQNQSVDIGDVVPALDVNDNRPRPKPEDDNPTRPDLDSGQDNVRNVPVNAVQINPDQPDGTNVLPKVTNFDEMAGLLMGLVQPLNPFADITNTTGSSIPIDEKLSTMLAEMLPAYVSEDHQTFILFLKAFYEYLEEPVRPRYESVKLNTYYDIDETLDAFVHYFTEQYASGFPSVLESGMSNRQLVKRIDQYYKEKGGSISVRLLFRILFGKEASVDYPRERLFALSQGDIKTISTMFVSQTDTVNKFHDVVGGLAVQYADDFYGNPQKGGSPTATGFIDSVTVSNFSGIDYARLELSNVRGDFLPYQDVDLQKGVTAFTESTFDQIAGITVQSKGKDYAVGQVIRITDPRDEIVANSAIQSVGLSGEITGVDPIIVDEIYKPYETYTITIESLSGSGATIDLVTGYANSFTNLVRVSDRSTLSSTSVIQDNERNQQLSYVIKVEEQLNKFKDIVKSVLHPVGSKMFSTFVNRRTFHATTFDVFSPKSSNTADNPSRFAPAIGNYTPYLGSGTFDLRGDTFGSTFIDYYPTGFNGLTLATIGTSATHDPITSGFTIGAMGGPSAGTQNPEAFGFAFGGVASGQTLAGYTVENIDQLIQVEGTDSTTAEFWIIYKHPKNTLKNAPPLGVTADDIITFNLDPEGFSAGHFTGFTTGFTTGDEIVQRSSDRRTAIGVFSGVTTSSPQSSKFLSTRAKGGTVAVNLSLTVKNGQFTNEPNTDGSRRYITNVRTGNTYDTIGTGDFDFTKITGSLTRFGWDSVVIGDFLNDNIF